MARKARKQQVVKPAKLRAPVIVARDGFPGVEVSDLAAAARVAREHGGRGWRAVLAALPDAAPGSVHVVAWRLADSGEWRPDRRAELLADRVAVTLPAEI